MSNDPINTLAQLALWRLEIDVAGKILAAVLVVACVVASTMFGEAGVVAVLWAALGGAVLLFLYLVVRAIFRDPFAEIERQRRRNARWASGLGEEN